MVLKWRRQALFHVRAEFLGEDISKLILVSLVLLEGEPLFKRELPLILLEASTHNLTWLVSEILIREVLAPFFHHCGNFMIRMVSSHLLRSLHRSMATPSNTAPTPPCTEPPLPMTSGPPLPAAAFSHSPLEPLRSPEPCLRRAPSQWEPLSPMVGAGPCTLTCQCSEPLESTGTTHQ